MCPRDVAKDIRRHIPDFKIDYNPDFRQAIADTWPESVDDSLAQKGGHWKPKYDLRMITDKMIAELGKIRESELIQ